MKMVNLSTPVDLDDPFTRIFGWQDGSLLATPDEVMREVFNASPVAEGDPALVPVEHDATRLAVARLGPEQEPGVALMSTGNRWIVRVYVFRRRPTPEEFGITYAWMSTPLP